mgnify:CR=1 FL=1
MTQPTSKFRGVTAATLLASAIAASTPIANAQANSEGNDTMHVQFIRFESSLPREQVLAVAEERMPEFQKIEGLRQKYYVALDAPNSYGGIYIWDSKEAMMEFRGSDLAAKIPQAYALTGKPDIEVIEALFRLRN